MFLKLDKIVETGSIMGQSWRFDITGLTVGFPQLESLHEFAQNQPLI